jgi:hypothetical protein
MAHAHLDVLVPGFVDIFPRSPVPFILLEGIICNTKFYFYGFQPQNKSKSESEISVVEISSTFSIPN